MDKTKNIRKISGEPGFIFQVSDFDENTNERSSLDVNEHLSISNVFGFVFTASFSKQWSDT